MIQCSESIDVRVFGGPTALIEIGGLRLLTDPTFDDVRDYELAAQTDSWSHFTEDRATAEAAFASAGLADRLQRDRS